MDDEDRRIAYLAGESGAHVDPAERARLDDLHRLLADPAMWAEPDASLEQRVVTAVERDDSARPSVRRRSRWIIYAVAGVAAAVLLGLVVGIMTSGGADRQPEFAVALVATPLAPKAHGRADLMKTSGGWRIRLNAAGLPRRDNGTYYEAWLKNRAGTLVPIGTFNQADGSVEVVLWAGVPPSSYPTMTVTQQQANGNPASSGRVVLIGTARAVR